MTTSWKRFIQNQTKRPVLELSTWTDKEPKPIEITAAEAQTISDATTKPQIQSSAIRQQTEPATISPAERYQTSQTNRELETYQEDMQTLRNENALSSAGRTIWDLQLSAQVAFDTMWTSNLETERERARQQFEKTRVKTLSYAKPILEKDEETQWLIESAKTWKTNMLETARKDAAEFGAGSAINTTFPNQWVSDNWDTVYFMNSKSTVTKPTLKNTLKFENSRIQDAYNWITYNFAQKWQMYTVQEVKDYYTEWQNVPDDVVQQFIYDACHDVQTWERRNIDLYAEYYPALSNWDKYVNQKDSLLQLLTDDNFIEYWLSEYLAGKTATGEDIDPSKSLQGMLGGEDITKILQAALTLTEAADELNEVGANITQATDYAIAKTYADQFPTIKEALDTFDRINISNEDFQKLVDNYNSNMGNIRQQFRYYGWDKGLSLTEYRKKVDDLVQENMREFNEEFINSWNKERIQWSLDYAESNIISDFFMWNAYRANDGKWYDRNWNEVERNDVNLWLANKYLDTFRSFTRHATELEYDTAFAAQDPSRESVINILSDSVWMAFDVFMMWKGWIELQTKFEIPYIGSIYQLWMDATMDQAWEMVLNLANLTLFYDGKRTPESQEKFKEAAGGLIFMLWMKEVAKTKWLVRENIRNDIYRSALRKSIKSYTDTLAKWLREIDVEWDQAKILQQQQPEPKPGENAKAEKQIESEKTNQKIMFIRNILEKAKKEFNKTFQEELSKEKGNRSIVDTLWNAAINLRQSEKATADTESRITREQERKTELEQRERDIDNEIINAKWEWNTDLVEQLRKQKQEIRDQIADIDGKIERLTEWKTTLKDKADEIVESVREVYGETVEWFREWGEEITTPEVRVEEATTEAPKTVEWTAKVKEPQWAKETKTTIAKILDVIQSIQDNAKEIVNNIFKPSEEKEIRQREQERIDRFNEFTKWEKIQMSPKELETLENNPFTQTILEIVDKAVTEYDKRWDKRTRWEKWETKEVWAWDRYDKSKDKNEVEREVLSSGLTRMQQFVDRVKKLMHDLWEIYDKLSKEKNINSFDFIKSDILRDLLDSYKLKIEIDYNKSWEPEAKVSKKDNVDPTETEEWIIRYTEDFINKTLRFEMKSEADVQADRTKLSWNEDTHWKYDDGFENNFRKAFNDFLDTQWEKTQLLRRLDAQFSNLKENLQLLDEVINKKWDLKDNAKNKILKWDEETLNQMESIFPGIKKLVELTRISSSIVNKVRDAKMKYREANSLFTSWWRYMAVLAGSTAWWALMFGWRGIPIAAFAFVWLERLWTAGKRKLWKKELDRDLYNKYIDLLNVDWNTKAKFKQEQLRLINEQIKLAKWKTDSQVQKTLDEALEILTLRKTNEIIQRKKRENERKQIEDQRKLEEWNRSQQPINNALPWMKPDIATAEWEITLWIWNPINPETLGAKWVKPQPKPIKEVKETYKDKEKTQQWYNEAEQRVLDMSQGVVEKEFSPEAEKLADVLEETIDNTASIIKKSAKNNLEERWEELTDENIAKEIQKEPSSIEEFIMETEKWAPEETTNYDGADIKDLEEVVANPKKYPNVDIEAAKSALEKARRQNQQAEIMQSPDQQQAQKEIAWIYKGNQMEREWNKGREKQREDMVRETNRDFNTLETTEEYDRIESQITPEKWEQAKKYAKWYKGFYRSDKAKTDTLRADMGKKPSQNITRTSSVDQIATLDNPKSRARVAQEKLNKRKRLSEEERTQLNQIIEQANVEIKAKEELKAQKTELANEYKALDKKRSETPYRETKKEITKQMDKISDEFDKLTYEEQGQFAKPKEVEAEEIKEAERIEEERQNLDMNETPQITEEQRSKELEWISMEVEWYDPETQIGAPFVTVFKDWKKIWEYDSFQWNKGLTETQMAWVKENIYKPEYQKNNETPKPKSMKSLKNMKPENLLKEPDSQEKFLAMEYQMLKLWNQYLSRMKEFKDKYDELFKKYRGENNEKNQEASSEKVVEWEKETKTDKLSREERKQLNQINKEIEDSLFYKWGTDARWGMTDREKIEFTNTLSPHEEFYHASDTNIKEWTFDLSKTKDDPNGLWLAVSTSKDNPYGWKKHQYTINWKNMLIAKEWTTTSESNIRDISEILQIEPNAAWQYVPLAELTSIIRWEVEAKFGEANNADILKAFRDVTKYDWIDTSHGYTLLWNVDKINANAKKNKGWDKPEESTTPKKPEPTKPQSPKWNMMANVKLSEEYGERKNWEAARPWDWPLLFVENDGTIRSVDEPWLWEIPTYKIQTRIEFLKQKRADNGKKLYAKELAELKFLQDLLKRQTERENREQGTEATEADLDRRENLSPGMGWIQQSWKWVSED